jgi:hypothetical protein
MASRWNSNFSSGKLFNLLSCLRSILSIHISYLTVVFVLFKEWCGCYAIKVGLIVV